MRKLLELQERLLEVNKAIQDIHENGQSSSHSSDVGSESFQGANLKDLLEERRELEFAIERERRGGSAWGRFIV